MNASLAGRTCLVTGASSGIGRKTARALAERGAAVVLVSRPSGAGAEVGEALRLELNHPDIHHLGADLTSLSDIRRAAAEVWRTLRRARRAGEQRRRLFFSAPDDRGRV
jgi:NAD(P)-dependent dehydrogenase (short-subunit alcohol dehydrogenase family)